MAGSHLSLTFDQPQSVPQLPIGLTDGFFGLLNGFRRAKKVAATSSLAVSLLLLPKEVNYCGPVQSETVHIDDSLFPTSAYFFSSHQEMKPWQSIQNGNGRLRRLPRETNKADRHLDASCADFVAGHAELSIDPLDLFDHPAFVHNDSKRVIDSGCRSCVG